VLDHLAHQDPTDHRDLQARMERKEHPVHQPLPSQLHPVRQANQEKTAHKDPLDPAAPQDRTALRDHKDPKAHPAQQVHPATTAPQETRDPLAPTDLPERRVSVRNTAPPTAACSSRTVHGDKHPPPSRDHLHFPTGDNGTDQLTRLNVTYPPLIFILLASMSFAPFGRQKRRFHI